MWLKHVVFEFYFDKQFTIPLCDEEEEVPNRFDLV